MNHSTAILLMGTLFLFSCEATFPLNAKSSRRKIDVIAAKAFVAPPLQIFPEDRVSHPGEKAYLRDRRVAANVSSSAPTLGVAFSGGGFRSGTFHLGVLQGLQETGILPRVDYLSCVSGGGYAGGWYVSHLRTQKELDELSQFLTPDELAHNFSTDSAQLLGLSSGDCKALDKLRNGGGLWGTGTTRAKNIGYSVGFLLGTMGPNAVQDLGIHLQPSPGKWNVFHPFMQYRRLLENYYFQGWEKVRGGDIQFQAREGYRRPSLMADVNSTGSSTPFLISCGALANSKQGGTDVDGRELKLRKNHLFEFTRLWCGSPLTGWIPTAYFDRPVADVNQSADGSKTTEVLGGYFPNGTTSPFRVSSAIAASGAAVDSAGVPTFKIFLNYLLGAINLNLRYQTANFNQSKTEWYRRVGDRIRETTKDRFFRSPESNTLQISDGAHLENLGVFALLRRSVPEIISFDGTADKKYKYSDLVNLLRLCGEYGWMYEKSPGNFVTAEKGQKAQMILPDQFAETYGRSAPENPIWKFAIRKPDGSKCQIYYVKSAYKSSTIPGNEWNFNHPLFQKAGANKAQLVALNPDGPNKAEISAEKDFPHIGTIKVDGWHPNRFDAYLNIGRYLARRVAVQYPKR